MLVSPRLQSELFGKLEFECVRRSKFEALGVYSRHGEELCLGYLYVEVLNC